MFASKNELFTRPSGSYQISRSVRLRSSASAYFNRATATTGNQQKLTWSGWVKRGSLSSSTTFTLFANAAASPDYISFSNDVLRISFVGGTIVITTNAVYRDPSAWYHVVMAIDTTQATAANRVLLWVNGVAVTSFSAAAYPSLNANTSFNLSGTGMIIGQVASSSYYDGYMAEINYIDGTALTPSSFGSTNAITGVWQPAKYTGTYGTNGYYLNFSDNSASTAATIGKDYSGNANNWTPNNISVTAGVTYDSMLDVPTPYFDGGNGRGNYAVLNPLNKLQSGTTTVISDGNLNITSTTAADYGFALSTMSASTKVYWESVITSSSAGNGSYIGASLATGTLAGANNCYYTMSGVIYLNAVSQGTFATIAVNDIIGNIYDPSTGTLTFYKNNTLILAVSTGWTGSDVFPFLGDASSNVVALTINFGQRPFTYTPPSGYVALNTQNLPTPTISNGANYMAVTTYTGNGGTQSVVNTGNVIGTAPYSNNPAGVIFQPDWVWNKSRSSITSHNLTDSVRGVQKSLFSNTTAAELSACELTAFNSNGFTLVRDASRAEQNESASTYVSWQWKAGAGTTSNITVGQYSTGPNVPSIASTVSVGATQGFSVVTYTGTGANATVGHGLGVAPVMIIAKSRGSAGTNWGVWHTSLTAYSYFLLLNTTAVQATAANTLQALPTSTVVSVGSSSIFNDASTMVMYCFSAVAGYSKFGSYTGNASTDGPFVFLGFRPRFIMIKNSSTTGSWTMVDTSRDTYNLSTKGLYADLSIAEDTSRAIDILSNGFKLRSATANNSADTFIYMAVAENPFKLSLAR